MEDQKATPAKKAAVSRWLPKFGTVCESVISNSILCAMDWLDGSPVDMMRLTPSRAADARVLLRAALCFGVAAAAAAVLAQARRLPAGRRLGLAHLALAFTAATHFIKIWLLCFGVAAAQDENQTLLNFLVAVAVAVFAAVDILGFVALLRRGVGVEEKESSTTTPTE